MKSAVLARVGYLLCLAGWMIAPAAQGALSASATISTSQTSAPFTYTMLLNNGGDTNIQTFWFAWTDTPASYDFLPTSPTNVIAPGGWTTLISHNAFPGDGYGLEMYTFGSGITPGNTGTFQFTTNDTPAQLAGNAFLPPNKVTASVVYAGLPQVGTPFRFTVAVPEPSSLAMVGVIGAAVIRRRRVRRV